LIGAVIESTRILDGCASTSWYVPGIGAPSGSRSYVPAGTIHVAIAASTISAKRIVYADGSAKPDFLSGSAACSLTSASPL
jgi:hypothetical protein